MLFAKTVLGNSKLNDLSLQGIPIYGKTWHQLMERTLKGRYSFQTKAPLRTDQLQSRAAFIHLQGMIITLRGVARRYLLPY